MRQWTTTLNAIKDQSPCLRGWKTLLTHLGKTTADDEPLTILTVLDSNGLDDALWCLRALHDHDREIRLFAVWCSRRVQHLMTDAHSTKALDVSHSFADGEATQKDLSIARDRAWSAWKTAVIGSVLGSGIHSKYAARSAYWAVCGDGEAARSAAGDAWLAIWHTAQDKGAVPARTKHEQVVELSRIISGGGY